MLVLDSGLPAPSLRSPMQDRRPPTAVPRGALGPWVLLGLAHLAAGCTSEGYSRRADRAVGRVLPDRADQVLGDREATVVHPEVLDVPETPAVGEELEGLVESEASEDDPSRPRSAPAPGAQPGEPAPPPAQVLTLRDALATAIQYNRSYQGRLEDLYLTTLSLVGTRHAFSPQIAALLSYLWADSDRTSPTHDGGLGVSLSQILPTGGLFSANASTSFSDSDLAGVDATYGSTLAIQLSQPLLRGAGYDVSHEPLVQAERNLVYAIREFELFREDFSIDVARRYYSLVESKRSIENQRNNMEQFTFARQKAEALFNVGRANELNFLRAKRQELNSLNALIEAEENYHLELDRFRIFLGLPRDVHIAVIDEAPTFVPVVYESASAVRVALQNRLDVLNRRQQLEDVERGVRLVKNGLLPDLDLQLSYLKSGSPDTQFFGQQLDDDDYSASLTFGIPLDRVNERNAYRSAEISLVRAQRSFDEFLDTVEIEVQSSVRELIRRRQSVEIQEELIEDERKNLRIAELQFEQGQIDNRDVVEASESLLDAQNRLISEQVSYEIARLSLLRELGILFIDEQGMWKE